MRSLEQRYRDAELITQLSERRLVRNCELHPRWLGASDRFWYLRDTSAGREWVLVDARARTRVPAFDHAGLGRVLTRALGREVDGAALPIDHVSLDEGTVRFHAFGRGWVYRGGESLERSTSAGRPDLLLSPDGAAAVYRKAGNLWLLDVASGAERALTTDGEALFAYGALPECRARLQPQHPVPPAPPEALWSPDGSRILTVQTDERGVKPLPLVDWLPADGTLRPRPLEVRVPWPGDATVPEYRLVSIDVRTGRQTAARWPRVPAVRMYDTPISANLAWWSDDGRTCWFVDVERGEKRARLVEFDTDTGRCRELFEESSATYVDLGYNVYAPCQSQIVPGTREMLWWSERSGYPHLYLVDLMSGRTVRAVTSGAWLVRDVLHVDAERREVWVTGTARVPGRHPYHREVLRVSLDGGDVVEVASDASDQSAWRRNEFALALLRAMGDDPGEVAGVSPTGQYCVTTSGALDRPPTTVLRDRDGTVVMELERGEVLGLPSGFRWPEVVTAKAADGTTDIWGVMVRPDEAEKPEALLPVVSVIYGGPQIDAVPRNAFDSMNGYVLQLCAYAQLGFVAVMFDGRGTPGRSKAFHDASYGRIERASDVDDHVAAIRQLAARHACIDLERVGITGFSGGGYATAGAMLRRPDFYKVGVAGGGNYDQRMFWASWGERFQGMLAGDNYAEQAHDHLADRLQGKLLFIHGLLDPGCHPAALFRLTEALVSANKDFELLLDARTAHRITGYSTRRSWDFFVRHLAGLEPPAGLAIKTGNDMLYERVMKQQREIAEFVQREVESAAAKD
jgi:dipeptidyl aminopeptidase/acylaminoacyl peptidase